nr:hypothetical protein [uncultured archaeon]AQS33486.1 hypothetical protein [uncultured archaeon]
MAILKSRDAKKLSANERKEKLKELKMELIRANVTANKTSSKTKEIKRAISRLLTVNNSNKEVLKKNK